MFKASKRKVIYTITILIAILITIYVINARYTVIVIDKALNVNQDRIITGYYDHFKKFGRLILEPDHYFIDLKVRSFVSSGSRDYEEKNQKCIPDFTVSEKDNKHVYFEKQYNNNRLALIIMDVWDCHYNGGWIKRIETVKKDKIFPLIELARKNNIPILYVSYDVDMDKSIKPLPGELVSDNLSEIVNYLDDHNVTTILYAGFSVNQCILYRPAGINNMRYNYYYDTILVRDATSAFEMPETLENEGVKKVSINIIESIVGPTTTLKDLEEAFSKL